MAVRIALLLLLGFAVACAQRGVPPRTVERLELERYLTDGRQAGAFPGWLREGAELEPERKTVKTPDAEPTEPVEVQEPADNP